MNKTLPIALLLIIAFVSCKNAEKEVDTLEIAQKYYEVLDTSDTAGIALLLADSLVTRETQYDYEQTFSLDQYVEWLKWDSLFDPTYNILHMEQVGETVQAKISKIDKRIAFLHQEPIVTTQVIRFNGHNISSIETTEYAVFNDSLFTENRDRFVGWVDENHPELSGVIHDQTKTGAMNYLKAMHLYNNHD